MSINGVVQFRSDIKHKLYFGYNVHVTLYLIDLLTSSEKVHMN